MSKQTVAIGNDHAGTDLKERIMKEYANQFEFINHGTDSWKRVLTSLKSYVETGDGNPISM